MPLTQTLFHLIAKTNSEAFVTKTHLILKRENSLRNVLNGLKEQNQMKETQELACKEANVKSIEELQLQYQGKFNESAMQTFLGAMTYTEQLVSSCSGVEKQPLEVKMVNRIKNLLEQLDRKPSGLQTCLESD